VELTPAKHKANNASNLITYSGSSISPTASGGRQYNLVIASLQSFHQSVAIAMNKDIGEINPDSTQPSGYASLWQTR
jgi:hypothetical protein